MFLHDEAHTTNDFFDGFHIETVLVALAGGIIFLLAAASVDHDAVAAGFSAVVALSPLWLPVALFIAFWKTWMHYIRYAFWFKTPMVLLHVELPPEGEKSPLAMELFFVGLWNKSGETTFLPPISNGQYRPL